MKNKKKKSNTQFKIDKGMKQKMKKWRQNKKEKTSNNSIINKDFKKLIKKNLRIYQTQRSKCKKKAKNQIIKAYLSNQNKLLKKMLQSYQYKKPTLSLNNRNTINFKRKEKIDYNHPCR